MTVTTMFMNAKRGRDRHWHFVTASEPDAKHSQSELMPEEQVELQRLNQATHVA